jgi:hypothetical protein
MRRRFGLARRAFRLSQVRPDVQSFQPRRSEAASCRYPSSCVRWHVLVWLSLASVLLHAKLHPRAFGAFQILDQARNAPLGRTRSMYADLHLHRKRNRKLLGKRRKHRAQSYRWARRARHFPRHTQRAHPASYTLMLPGSHPSFRALPVALDNARGMIAIARLRLAVPARHARYRALVASEARSQARQVDSAAPCPWVLLCRYRECVVIKQIFRSHHRRRQPTIDPRMRYRTRHACARQCYR